MINDHNIQPTITAKQAQQKLADHGMNVSEDQAKAILEFLTIFAKAFLKTNATDRRSIHPCKHRRAS